MTTAAPLRSPQELYEDWERSHWAAQDVELARDVEQWQSLDETERGLLYWVLSALLAAEERISTQFVGLVYAQDDEEEGSYLSTQLVDEVRHMQFYARFQNEVVADPAAIAEHVARAREVLAEPFRIIFDEALGAAHARLIAEPRDREAKVAFVTVYHQILEGTLGLTSYNFVTGYLEREALLPGFVKGYSKIHHDEQRHIGYGTWFLREALRDEPGLADNVRVTLRSLLPAVAEALTPPDREGTDWDALGASSDEIRAFAVNGLSRRLNIVGVPLDSL